MSNELECPSCGALSSPSLGACPYCKSVLAPSKKIEKENPKVSAVKAYYSEGKLQEALFLGIKLWRENEKMKESANFLTIFAKTLFESEAYPAILNSVLAQNQFLKAPSPAVNEIKRVVHARARLEVGKNDFGELQLKEIISDNPKSAYAHFTLGTHLYFVEKDLRAAIFHLEEAVKHHPNFLRAWGCLGAIYRGLNKPQLATRAFKQAAKLETNKNMKKFFKDQI